MTYTFHPFSKLRVLNWPDLHVFGLKQETSYQRLWKVKHSREISETQSTFTVVSIMQHVILIYVMTKQNNFMQAYLDKQKKIIFGKMLHVDNDNYSQHEWKITTNYIRSDIIKHEIMHLLFVSYWSTNLVPELCQNTLEYIKISYLISCTFTCLLSLSSLVYGEIQKEWKIHEIFSVLAS